MIGLLQGAVELIDRPHVIVNVGGVGYRVLVSGNLLGSLKPKNKVKIYTYTHVKEDTLELFGFNDLADLKLFENFLTVPGIGPKTAMNIFSFHKREDIVNAILRGDVSLFTSVPRLGTKNAQKIIIELKGKLGSTQELDLSGEDLIEQTEVINALKNFGFTTLEAQKAIRETKKDGLSTEEKIRLSLKYLGSSKHSH